MTRVCNLFLNWAAYLLQVCKPPSAIICQSQIDLGDQALAVHLPDEFPELLELVTSTSALLKSRIAGFGASNSNVIWAAGTR